MSCAQIGQPAAALLGRAEPVDRHGAERDGRLQRYGHRGIDPGQFLQRQAQREVIAAHAAELLREWQPEQALLRHPGDNVVGELSPFVVSADHRRDNLMGEIGDGLAQRLLLFAEPVADHPLMLLARRPGHPGHAAHVRLSEHSLPPSRRTTWRL